MRLGEVTVLLLNKRRHHVAVTWLFPFWFWSTAAALPLQLGIIPRSTPMHGIIPCRWGECAGILYSSGNDNRREMKINYIGFGVNVRLARAPCVSPSSSHSPLWFIYFGHIYSEKYGFTFCGHSRPEKHIFPCIPVEESASARRGALLTSQRAFGSVGAGGVQCPRAYF